MRLTPGRKNDNPEFRLTVAVATMMRRRMPPEVLWTHFPAGELRDARTAAKLKHMGLQPGWPDFPLVMPDARLYGLEIKSDKGRLTDEQALFGSALRRMGGCFEVVRSLDQAEAVLTEWLAPFNLQLRGRRAA